MLENMSAPGFVKDPNNTYTCKDVDECNPINPKDGNKDLDLVPCNAMHGSCENTQASFQLPLCTSFIYRAP